VKAVQDEASPAAFRSKTPEAKGLLLAERYFFDGLAEALAAVEELTKSTESKTNSSVQLE
jgi:hypothetical protein